MLNQVARNFDFGLNSEKPFQQSENIHIPSYFYPTFDTSLVHWGRPRDLDPENEKEFGMFSITEREETM